MVTKKWWVLVGTGIAAIIIAIDFTIVYASLAKIQVDLTATTKQLQWIVSGFGLVLSSLLITAGRLGDLRGRRRFMYIGIIGFGFASLGAGLAQTPQFLIAMRILQGLFGSAIFPCGMAITASAFSESERARVLGIYSAIAGAGLAMGPVIGSLIMTLASWRWVFLVNIPFVVLSMIICIPVIKESKLSISNKIDWLGTLWLIISVGTLIFIFNAANEYGWISRPMILCYIVVIIASFAFIFTEKYIEQPLVPFHLFNNKGFWAGLIVYVVSASFAWPILFFMPLFLQLVQGYSVGQSGLILFAMTSMTAVAPIFAGYWYDKYGKLTPIHIMFLTLFISLFIFNYLSLHISIYIIIFSFFCYGFGWGIGNGIAAPLALSYLSNTKDAGLVTGALITLMNLIAVIGLSFMGLLVHNSQKQFLLDTINQNNIQLNKNQLYVFDKILLVPEQLSNYLHYFPINFQKNALTWLNTSFTYALNKMNFILLILLLIFWVFTIKLLKVKK